MKAASPLAKTAYGRYTFQVVKTRFLAPRNLRLIVATLISAVAMQGAVFAAESTDQQEAALGGQSESSTLVYEPGPFIVLGARTAEDMLRRIPGVTDILDSGGGGGGNQRGFGSGGDQILIGGRRLAGKSNQASNTLRRIQAASIQRIELIRGTSGDIDVESKGVVVNLVLKAGENIRGAGSVLVAGHVNEFGSTDFDGNISYNGNLRGVTYLLSFERSAMSRNGGEEWTDMKRDERYYFASGAVQELRQQQFARRQGNHTFTANAEYGFASGARLQLNGLVQSSNQEVNDTTELQRFAANGAPTLTATDFHHSETDGRLQWEVGGEYTRPLGQVSDLTVLWVYNHEKEPTFDTRDRQPIGGARQQLSISSNDSAEEEAILRASVSRPLTTAQNLEAGGEVARNTLDQTLQLYSDTNGDGIVEPVTIFDPTSQVSELRSEIFGVHNWTINNAWTMQSSLNAEFSRITQQGLDVHQSRSFAFLKPRVDLRYTLGPSDLLRFKAERTVSQLNFGDFVPRYDSQDRRVDAGNPDLVPQTALNYELAHEHRLADDLGVVEMRVYFVDISNRIERVAIDPDLNGVFSSATGNIGAAREVGAELKFGVRMGWLGLRDLLISGSTQYRDTRVTDPFTGARRKMGMTRYAEDHLGFRHDVTRWKFSYGANYAHNRGPACVSDYAERRCSENGAKYDGFLEKRLFTSATLRFEAWGVNRRKDKRARYVYVPNRGSGTLSRIESFHEVRDQRFGVSMRFNF